MVFHKVQGGNMSVFELSKQENKILNSIEIQRAISYLQIVKGQEKTLLYKILMLMPFEQKGYDILGTVTAANGSLGKALGVTNETIGRLKESLHARGIIEVDGKTWDQYRYADGRRYRAKWIHRVTLSQSFALSLYDAAKTKTKINFDGNHHPDFVAKLQDRRKRNLAAVIKSRMLYVVNNLLESCESIPMSSLSEVAKNISMSSLLNLKGSFLNTQNKASNPTTVLREVNQNLSNAIGLGKREYKKWTEAVKKICLTLIESGKTVQEVAAIMVKQSYCKNFEHFTELMQSTPMLC